LTGESVGVPGGSDDVVFGLALGGNQPEADGFDDRPFDINVTVVVIRDHDGLLPGVVSHFVSPFSGVPDPALT
jgi:hypothetical protein